MKSIKIVISVIIVVAFCVILSACSFNYAFNSKSVDRIELDLQNVKTQYFIGENFDGSDIKVSKVFNEGSIENVKDDEIIIDNSNFDNSIEGSYEIFVSVKGVDNIKESYSVTVRSFSYGYYVRDDKNLDVKIVNLHLQNDMVAVYEKELYDYTVHDEDGKEKLVLKNENDEITFGHKDGSIFNGDTVVSERIDEDEQVVCFGDLRINDIVVKTGEVIPKKVFDTFDKAGMEVYNDADKNTIFDRTSIIDSNTVVYVLPSDERTINLTGYYFSPLDLNNPNFGYLTLAIKDKTIASYLGIDYAFSLEKLSKGRYKFTVDQRDFEAIFSEEANAYQIFGSDGKVLQKAFDDSEHAIVSIYDGENMIEQTIIKKGEVLKSEYILNENIEVLAYENTDMYVDVEIFSDTNLYVADINHCEDYVFEDTFVNSDYGYELSFDMSGVLRGLIENSYIEINYACKYYKYKNKYEVSFVCDGYDYNFEIENGAFLLETSYGILLYESAFGTWDEGCIIQPLFFYKNISQQIF